jgi:hypothetical protein
MSEKPANQGEAEDQVKLKPVMGIRPGIYLTILYSVILLVALFFLLVFPGIKNAGALLSARSEPAGAAIRVDGIYMGASGDRIFVPNGTHVLEAVLPGFQSERVSMEIKGRIFGSLFFPSRVPVDFTLRAVEPAAAFAQSAADFAAWSFGPEPSVSWQIPLSLSEGAYRTGPENDPLLAEYLHSAARFTVTRAALRDLIRAKILLDNGGLSPSPAGLAASVSEILVFLSENSGSAAWLSGLLPPEAAVLVENSAWYKNEKNAAPPSQRQILDTAGRTAGRLELAGLSFTGIAAGTLYRGGSSRGIDIKSFLVSENPVPRTVYEAFLGENPEWKGEQDNFYPAELFTTAEVTGVSWFAAQAFCRWLTKQLPGSMASMEVRLPTEAEWEYAALGVSSMENTLWEWCADPFAPLLFIEASARAVQAVGSPERSLKSSGVQSAIQENRASLPPDFTSPVVSFRPVIAERDSGY